MELTDTHCHIHAVNSGGAGDDPTQSRWHKAGKTDADAMIGDALSAGVTRLICVGTDLEDSMRAIDFASPRVSCWASIGLHPHESSRYASKPHALAFFKELVKSPKVVAIGECGLDYYYEHSGKADQAAILRLQLSLALENNLPLIFHVRDAFDDFWKIFDEFNSASSPVRGVIHSFSADPPELEQIHKRNLFVGLNGIMTFTKNPAQLDAVKALPLQKILLETDAPFLTPHPFRGTICEPKHVRVTAEFLSDLRGEPLESLAAVSTRNARDLFNI